MDVARLTVHKGLSISQTGFVTFAQSKVRQRLLNEKILKRAKTKNLDFYKLAI